MKLFLKNFRSCLIVLFFSGIFYVEIAFAKPVMRSSPLGFTETVFLLHEQLNELKRVIGNAKNVDFEPYYDYLKTEKRPILLKKVYGPSVRLCYNFWRDIKQGKQFIVPQPLFSFQGEGAEKAVLQEIKKYIQEKKEPMVKNNMRSTEDGFISALDALLQSTENQLFQIDSDVEILDKKLRHYFLYGRKHGENNKLGLSLFSQYSPLVLVLVPDQDMQSQDFSMGVTGFDLKKIQLSDMFRVTEPFLFVNYDHYLSEHTFNMVKNNSKLVNEELNRGLIKGVTVYDDKVLIFSVMQFNRSGNEINQRIDKSVNLEQKIKRYKLELYLADGNPSFCEVAFN